MIKKYSLVIIVFLCAVLSGFGQADYTLVNSVSDLTPGSKYILVSSDTGSAYAMGLQNNNNRAQETITIASGVINTSVATLPADNKPFEIILGGSVGAWTLFDAVNNGYLYAANTGTLTNNYLRTRATPIDEWTITFSSGVAVIKDESNTTTRKILKYNSQSSLFSCYASGQSAVYLYKLTPSTPCSGTPTPGNTLAASNPVVSGDTTVLSLQNATSGSGVTYQWQISTTSASTGFTNISAATAATYTASPTTKTWYRCVVTCSGNSGTSTAVEVNITVCSSLPTSNDNSGITSVTIGSATFPVSDVTQYTYTGSIPNLTQGVSVASSLTFATGYDYNTHIWIDFNDDSVFNNTNEKVFTGVSLAANPTTLNTTFTLSGTATLGQHKMRIGTADSGQATPDPCYSGSFGVTIDLDVNIIVASVNPVLSITGSTSHGSICPGTAASSQTYTITNTGGSAATGVTVISSNSEFVVSALSSTSIASGGGTATYVVTFTPTIIGPKTAIITVASTTSGSNSPTKNLTGTGSSSTVAAVVTNTATTITTVGAQVRATSSTFGICPNTIDKGFVYAVNSANPNPQNTGTGVTTSSNPALGGAGGFNQTISGLSEGTTYSFQAYLFDGTTYTYGGVQTFTTTITNPNTVTNTAACMLDDAATVTWTPPASGLTPTGYMVFVVASATTPIGTPTTAVTDYNYVDSNFLSTTNTATPASLGKLVYKGTGNSATVTGLTENTVYSFLVLAYRDGGSIRGFANAAAGGRTLNKLAQDDISNLAATAGTYEVALSWNLPTPVACFDELIIVANQGNISFTPTGSYAPITGNYSTPNAVVYATTGTPPSSRTIAGLTNNLNYCFKIYIRRGIIWSDGVEVCATPTLTYCDSNGNIAFKTGISKVVFGSINNSTSTPPDNNAYSDFTSQVANVLLGDLLDLSVNVNTDGNFTTYTKVWIDWNQDGTFNTTTEEYDLGTAYNATDGPTSESPLSIEVPTNAAIGTTRMRVSNKYLSYSTPCATGFDGEVEDYSINVQPPTDAEINVKGLAISIPNGFNTPYGLNNTLFAATNIGANSIIKDYTIENIGLATLFLGSPSVILTGDHPGDFIIVAQPSTTNIGSASTTDFRIRFRPTADGVRTAIVSIQNSDITGNEDPYTFKIQGTGVCTSSISSIIFPNSGPVGTEITITSPSSLTGASATINGLPMTVVSSTVLELVVQIPIGAISGPLNLILSNGCSSSNAYTVINNAINGCQASSASTIPSDLFISEVTDGTSGSSSFVEIFNGSSTAINLASYSIRIFNNGSSTQSSTNALIGTIAAGGNHVITIGTTDCPPENLGGGVVNQTFNNISGINFKTNSSDAIALYKNATRIDIFGTFGSTSWANNLGIGVNGVDFRRKNTATPLPSATFNINDWDVIDWTSCSDSNYVNLGAYDFSIGVPPAVTLQPIAPINACDLSAVLTIAGTEGYNPPIGDTAELTYQWFFNSPGTNVWTEISSSNTDYIGQQTVVLTIPNTLNLDNYQYYCQIRESGVTCFKASNAVKIKVSKTIWNGTTWTPSAPDISTIAVINSDYDMTSSGANLPSFSACQLLINSGASLTVANSNFVEIQNNVINNGNIYVAKQGSFVQIADAGTITLNSSTAKNTVSKFTTPLLNWYDYTYWSSPLKNAQIEVALFPAKPSRRYVYNASAFIDIVSEVGNTGTFNPGSDDIDDFGNDWVVQQTGTMVKGKGYAATHNTIGFMTPNTGFQYIFEGTQASGGEFNTGNIAGDIYIAPAPVTYNNWNLIGNPYPSAVNSLTFLQHNSSLIEGVIYLWSHKTSPSNNNSGNENQNFSQDDYAIINYTGGTAVTGQASVNGSAIPNGYIASGQGFFVIGKKSGATSGAGYYNSTVFTNAMRATNNEQFFRTSETPDFDKLWVNLTSDNGIFSQVLIGYMEGASNNFDGMQFDAYRNLSTANSAILYTTISDSEKKFAIQARNPQSLTLEESIPLGFQTLVTQPTSYSFSIEQLQGVFLTSNTIFIKDNMLNLTHNLSASDYIFSSEPGEFNTRFEIVFKDQALSVIDNEITAEGLSIIELTDGRVKFVVGNNLDIKAVEILDMLGRMLYTLKGDSPTEIYELSNLSQAAYIAKVTLSNGQVVTKRAVKRK